MNLVTSGDRGGGAAPAKVIMVPNANPESAPIDVFDDIRKDTPIRRLDECRVSSGKSP